VEWEILLTPEVEAFLDELYDSDRVSHQLVNQAILVLERNGPGEGRPLVDSITASRIANMKELPAAVSRARGDPDPAGVRSVAVRDPARGRRQVGAVGAVVPDRDPARGTAVRGLLGRAEEGDGPVSSASRWRDSGHLERAVETAGGPEAFDAAVSAMLDDARGWRLAELRKRRGMTQDQVAARMGVSVARVSQIERGDVSTQDVLNRFIAALGGTLKLIADFGDEQLKIA